MPTAEFDLIRRCFRRELRPDEGDGAVLTGIGDDCAVLQPRPGHQWCVSTDTLVEGRHFIGLVDPVRLGHKALAVNLSDLAACGAQPRAFFLALTLPRADTAWCSALAQGLFALADAHGAVLAGGDTTSGPLSLTLTVMGEVPAGLALLRSGAQAGDDVWVSGTLGGAWLGLQSLRQTLHWPVAHLMAVRDRLERPEPRVGLGQALRGIASSAIDLSDGLVADLGHVVRASSTPQAPLRMVLDAQALPAHDALLQSLGTPLWCQAVLAGGDDYELAFTAPASARAAVIAAGLASATPVHCMGRVESVASGESDADPVQVLWRGEPMRPPQPGFIHF